MLNRFRRFSWIPIAIIFLGLGLIHLGKFLNRDESLWLYDRVPKYYNAWFEWELSRSYINDKPGVLPAILAGTVNLFDHYSEYDYQNFHQYLFWWRLPILVFNATMLIIIFFLIVRLLDYRAAILISGMMALLCLRATCPLQPGGEPLPLVVLEVEVVEVLVVVAEDEIEF